MAAVAPEGCTNSARHKPSVYEFGRTELLNLWSVVDAMNDLPGRFD
jgi:hypothetical protein